MNIKHLLPGLAAALLLSVPSVSGQTPSKEFSQALDLYANGAYGRARTLFEGFGDELSQGYAILCAIKAKTPDYVGLMERYMETCPYSVLVPDMHFEYGQNLFDEGEYAQAAAEYAQAEADSFSPSKLTEFDFKRGYCAFAQGDYKAARGYFDRVEKAPASTYTAPARYAQGYMDYAAGRFRQAEQWFRQSVKDKRFEDLSIYYLLECRFNDGDYDYVLENGPQMMDRLPAERAGRLARMLSESYLVKGDKDKAYEYLQKENSADRERTRSDFFHAGSVLYAMGDYTRAVSNLEKMQPPTEPLGQVANYNLAYAYIQNKDKVSAVNAFKDAAAASFDKTIQEDAFFNYSKLAFDLNNDSRPFREYLDKYPSTEKKEQIFNYIAIAALRNKDFTGAIDAYSNIESLDPSQQGNFVKANYLRANQLISGGNWSDAIPFLKAAGFYLPKTDRFNQLARYWLAEAYSNTGDYAGAESIYTTLYNNSSLRGMQEGTMLPYNLAYCYYNSGKFDSAAKWFDLYTSSHDAYAREDALTRRADCDFARRNYRAAIASYQRVLNEFPNPDKVYPYYQQALAYGLSGDRKSKVNVLSTVKKASPSAPLYAEALYELGRSYMDLDNNAEAVKTFELLRRNVSDNTSMAKALIGKGMAYRNAKQYPEALAEYKTVVSMLPGSEYSEEAMLAINSIYQTTGEPEKYLEYIEENNLGAGKSAAEREEIWFNTAEQVYLAGNYPQAVNSLMKYMQEFPGGARTGDAYFYLGECYRNMGEKEKAAENYAKVRSYLKKGAFAENAAKNYAAVSYELERFEEAYGAYRDLEEIAAMEENRNAAIIGRMRSAYKAKHYEDAISDAGRVRKISGIPAPLSREADYLTAKSYLALSRRADAMEYFDRLSSQPSTPEGAEASYMLVQNLFDSGKFAELESKVYDFSTKCGSQSYWLARCYIVLGDSFYEKGNNAQAKATWESIRSGYVPSDDGDDIIETVNGRLAKLQ